MARLTSRALLVIVTIAVVLYGVVLQPFNHAGRAPTPRGRAPSTQPAMTPMGDVGYPRLANYNGLRDVWQIPFFAHDDLVVARRGAPVRRLAAANPRALTLLYERSLQVDLCCAGSLYGIKTTGIPPGWWLVAAGSSLAGPINAAQTWIPVVDARPFARCQDVLLDGENMHVWAVTGRWLRVLRGYYSAARPHPAGARIAPHYSYRTDLSNCVIYGRVTSARPWSFNMSSLCLRWHGQTWADYLARRVAYLVRRDGWRGVFYDNLQDFPPSPLVDTAGTGRADGGIVGGVNVWRAGQRALLAATRRLLPGAPILVNGDLRIDGLAQGREMEGFPLIPGDRLAAAIDAYEYDAEAGQGATIVNADNVTRLTPQSASADTTVGVSLLGAGYAAYDRGWLTHGDPWWFDAYDGGRGSALARRVNAAATILPVARPRRFRRGDIVLVDQEAMGVRRVLNASLLVWRGMLGTTPVWHTARTTVTTARQRARGHAYLGRALGPPRLVPTGDWSRRVLPLTLVKGGIAPAGANGRLRRLDAQAVSSATRIQASAPWRYRADAAELTFLAPSAPAAMRTLVFTARGPAGATLWLDPSPDSGAGATRDAPPRAAGPTAVPLVLRSSWRRYVIPVGGSGRIALDLSRVGGRVDIKGMQLLGTQAYVLRRDFAHGIVLVNPTDRTQRVRLERPYRVLSGDGAPQTGAGQLVRYLSIARYRAAILLSSSA